MEEKPATSRRVAWVAALVVLLALYVASIGPFVAARNHYPELDLVIVIYKPLGALDDATDRKYITPYVMWWVSLVTPPQ